MVDIRGAGEEAVAGRKMMIQTRRPLVVVGRLRKLECVGIGPVNPSRVIRERRTL
jgi:hypothetical protein